MTDDLIKLAERCESATGADRALDGVVHILANPDKPWIVGHKPGRFPQEAIHGTLSEYLEWAVGLCDNPDPHRRADVADSIGAPAYTASIDAALTLVGSLPWGMTADPAHGAVAHVDCNRAEAATPALALTAAALRARASDATSKETGNG